MSMQFTNCMTCEPLFYDPYELCEAIHESYLFDSIGQGWVRTGLEYPWKNCSVLENDFP